MEAYRLKIREYQNIVNHLKRKPKLTDQLTFSDGTNVAYWFYHQKTLCNQINLTEEQRKKKELFLTLLEEVKQIDSKEIKLERRVSEYIEKVKKLGQNVPLQSMECFTDGKKMGAWYQQQSRKYQDWRLEERELSKEEMKEISLFAKIDDALYAFTPIEIWKKRSHEFIQICRALGKIPSWRDQTKFSDGVLAGKWYQHQISKLERYKHQETCSEREKKEMSLIQELQNMLNVNYNKNHLFYKKVSEYLQILQYTQTPLKKSSLLKFSDGSLMIGWYYEQNRMFRNWVKENRILTQEEMSQLMAFAQIDLYQEQLKETLRSKKGR